MFEVGGGESQPFSSFLNSEERMNPWTERLSVTRVAVVSASVLIAVAAVASFAFAHHLARLAGTPSTIAWLWPIVVGLTVFQIAYCYVMVGTLPYRTGIVRLYFGVLLLSGVAAGVLGNAFNATDPGELSPAAKAIMSAVPPLCLLLMVLNTSIFLSATKPWLHGADNFPRRTAAETPVVDAAGRLLS
ncbi:hypothetical protein [Nocardia sp. NPDC049526]|uniref:hypothetical protein n=1 Tax=Nocardia sp. NPDC049526 TaxID=3364316 RepID=UPI00378E21FC